MTPEEIIAMAKETIGDYSANDYWPFFTEELQKFAAQVAAKERESCALVCDEIQRTKAHKFYGQLLSDGSARQAAAAIRARGTKEGA